MPTPNELRARAAELEDRVPPAIAGPRTDDERMWLEKARVLLAEADRLDSADPDALIPSDMPADPIYDDEDVDDPHAGCIHPHRDSSGEYVDCDGKPL